jgi:tetratricopeptide (TPR) repeat protein
MRETMQEDNMVDFDALWNYNDPAASEAAFHKVLPQAAGDAEQHAQLLTQIARAQGLQGKFDLANSTLDQAQRLLPANPSRAHVRLLLERGRVLNTSGRPADSVPVFKEAFELASTLHDDDLAIDAAHMLGIVLPAEDALRWNERALAMAEATTDAKARQWAGALQNNTGWIYHGMGRHEDALDCFKRALQSAVASGKVNSIRIARWCVGRELRALNRVDEALSIQRELLVEWEAAGGRDGFVFEELAECALLLHQHDEARRYAAQAHEALSQIDWLVQQDTARLERLKAIANSDEQD